ncbi:MAG: HDOD domain-containing protein, partial [Acidimicrobiales bacterium]
SDRRPDQEAVTRRRRPSGRYGPRLLGRVARIIETDLSITTKILGLVNSAFFALPKEVCSVKDAVVYLGIENVRALAATADVFRALADNRELASLAAELQAHSQAVLEVAQFIHPNPKQRADLYVGALLHDIGLLAVASLLPEAWAALTNADRGGWDPEAERALVGATHSEIGAYLLALWELPYGAVEIVALHHDELPIVSAACLSDIEVVRVADALQSETEMGVGHTPERDRAYLQSLGIDDQLDVWRHHRSASLRC